MRALSFLVILAASASLAVAENGSFDISGGYSRLHTGRTGGLRYESNGGYVDGDVNWRVGGGHPAPPVLLGFGVGASGYYRNIGGGFFEDFNQSSLTLVSLEGRASFPIPLRFARGLFIMPRIGAGLLIDDYAIDVPSTFTTEYHTGPAFEIRPALQAGYSWGRGSVGAEVSYMAAWGDFGKLGATAHEIRAGVFLRFRF